MASRRQFIQDASLVVAAAGLSPLALLRATARQQMTSLQAAVLCAEWIDRSAQSPSGDASRAAWPNDPLRPERIDPGFYNGMPGVVYFYGNLAQATGDQKWRTRAVAGGRHLLDLIERTPALNGGLYTGLAGLAATFLSLHATGAGAEWEAAARTTTATLVARATPVADGVEWSASNDIVSGTAGTGLWLLRAGAAWKDQALIDLAAKAGRRLIANGVAADGGLMWFPGGTSGANYPNFSHGTSGVAYFLATLYQHTKDRAFLDAAVSGAKYLDAVATRRDGARAIFHVTGGGEKRFYLSWCHGPVGTARLFQRLALAGAYPEARTWLVELTNWLAQSGAPERQSDGYWNNISQCCGNVGIGQYFIDLARHAPAVLGGVKSGLWLDRISDNTLLRATRDEQGLRWVQAENRTQPANLVAQTGFMQGAAGVGAYFLQRHAFERRQPWPAPLPDTPWV
jgi:lantibiotic modifying enzyme